MKRKEVEAAVDKLNQQAKRDTRYALASLSQTDDGEMLLVFYNTDVQHALHRSYVRPSSGKRQRHLWKILTDVYEDLRKRFP